MYSQCDTYCPYCDHPHSLFLLRPYPFVNEICMAHSKLLLYINQMKLLLLSQVKDQVISLLHTVHIFF